MMKSFLFLFLGLIFIIGLAIFFTQPVSPTGSRRIPVILGSMEINAEIAETIAERNRGLSGREELKEGEGMLFIFAEEGKYGFWMRDMNFPIDIVWIDAEKRVIGVEESVSPDSYPQVFRPDSEAMYVLELPAGYSSAHSITSGGKVYFEYKNH